jgi:predicted dehydrogenase
MSEHITIGIIGAGMIGDVHINTIRNDGRGKVKWIAAATDETLLKKLSKHDIKHGTLDYNDILNDPEVDAVVIASPPFTHLEMTFAAIESGKHILLEKPMTVNMNESNQIIEKAKNYSKVLLECSCRHARLQPKFRFAKKMIEDGELGEVYHIHHNHLMRSTFIEYNPAGKWALDKTKAGGGPFLDWGVYDLSFHLGLLNDEPNLKEIKSFTKSGLKKFKDKNIKQNVEEHGAAYMEFNSGLTYYYERGSGVHCETANETRIYGTKGSLRFGYCSWDSPVLDYFYTDNDENEKLDKIEIDMSKHSDDNQELMKHFLDCIINGTKPMMTPALAGKHLGILFKILSG